MARLRSSFVVAAGEQLPLPSPIASTSSWARPSSIISTRGEPRRSCTACFARGGRAAFAEPLGTNPLIAFARDHLPYPGKNPRGADVPLSYADIRAWEAPFAVAEHREVQLLEMVERALGLRPACRACAEPTTGCWPVSRRFGGYAGTSS